MILASGHSFVKSLGQCAKVLADDQAAIAPTFQCKDPEHVVDWIADIRTRPDGTQYIRCNPMTCSMRRTLAWRMLALRAARNGA
jgi:hypothetical protein